MSPLNQAFGKFEHAFFVLGGNNGIIGCFHMIWVTVNKNKRNAPFCKFINIFAIVSAGERINDNAGYLY